METESPKQDNAGAKLHVSGKVQQVGFRWFTCRWAKELGLSGFAKNLDDGTVRIEAEGKKSKIESLISEVKSGPHRSHVDEVRVEWIPFEHRFRDFEIRR